MEILEYLKDDGRGLPHLRHKATRNRIAYDLDMETDLRKVTYALERLRSRGLVEHVKHGNEGHGYWKITDKEDGS